MIDLDEYPRREQPYLDIIFPSNNEYSIPTLDIEKQPTGLDLQISAWGEKSRAKDKTGLVHFYVDDYRFNSLWSKPYLVSDKSYTSAVEPNVTVSLDSPIAWVIWATYQKRWLARFWQAKGINIWVDLNVVAEHQEINLMGVPDGWNAFATHGYSDRLEMLHSEYAIAQRISGNAKPLFCRLWWRKSCKTRMRSE